MLLLRLEPAQLVALLTALVVGLSVHEFAHAWSAFKLGDRTAEQQGRLTLDPRSHIEPIGALMMLMVGFGWARPVPINPYTLGRQGTLLVSLAGPVSNLLLATGAALLIRLIPAGLAPVESFLYFFLYLNVLLAVFNMLPIAPLDGWKVLLGLVPPSTEFRLRQYERHGMLILLVLVFAGSFLPGNVDLLWTILGPPVDGIVGLLGRLAGVRIGLG